MADAVVPHRVVQKKRWAMGRWVAIFASFTTMAMGAGGGATDSEALGSVASAMRFDGAPLVSVLSYGARCDGITDDTAAMQRAFDNSSARRSVLTVPAGRTCMLRAVGLSARHVTSVIPYALSAPSHLRLACGRGSVLKAAIAASPGVIPTLIVSVSDNAVGSTGIEIDGCTLDQDMDRQPHGNPEDPPAAHAIVLENVVGLRVRGLNLRNVASCGWFIGITGASFSGLSCRNVYGTGFWFGAGIAKPKYFVSRSTIRNVFVHCGRSPYWTHPSYPGNDIAAYLMDSTVSHTVNQDCGGGSKYEGDSSHNLLRNIVYIGGPHSTANSGLKFQADATGAPSFNSVIGLITSNVPPNGFGFHVIADEMRIPHHNLLRDYVGRNNVGGEFNIRGSDTTVLSWRSIDSRSAAGSYLIDIRDLAERTHLGTGVIETPQSAHVNAIIVRNEGAISFDGGRIIDPQGNLAALFYAVASPKGRIGVWVVGRDTDMHRSSFLRCRARTAGDFCGGIVSYVSATSSATAVGFRLPTVRYDAKLPVVAMRVTPANAAARILSGDAAIFCTPDPGMQGSRCHVAPTGEHIVLFDQGRARGSEIYRFEARISPPPP